VGWALIVVFPLALMGGAEACVRVLGLQPASSPEASPPAWLDRNILVKETRWMELLSESPRDFTNYYRTYRWDRELFYRLAPGLDLPLTDITAPPPLRERTRWIFHTNSVGFNSREATHTKPPGTLRIVTLGDSSTFGWGVDTEETYPYQLERLLRERHPDRRIEVVNLGVCGYSSLQGLILLRREGLRYSPDIVILSYGSNDYSLVPEPFDVVVERNRGWVGGWLALTHASRAYQVYASYLRRAAAGLGIGARRPEGTGVLNVGPDKSRANLVEMTQLSKEAGADPVFVTNCVPGEMADPLLEAARRTGTPVLDSRPLLEGAVEGILSGDRFSREFLRYRGLYPAALLREFPWLAVYLTDQCHPNVVGHRLIAEALVPMVEATAAFGRPGTAGVP